MWASGRFLNLQACGFCFFHVYYCQKGFAIAQRREVFYELPEYPDTDDQFPKGA